VTAVKRRRRRRRTIEEEVIKFASQMSCIRSLGGVDQNLREDGITGRYALKHVSTNVLHPCRAIGSWQ
jgi:hypothetical protein